MNQRFKSVNLNHHFQPFQMLKKRLAACFLSGGVDSAVATGIIARTREYEIQPIYVRNWDSRDELGYCQADVDLNGARKVCQKLKLEKELLVLDCVGEYYSKVFEPTVESYENGGKLGASLKKR